MKTVGYLGKLFCFKRFGDCGNHPQFNHINHKLADFDFSISTRPFFSLKSFTDFFKNLCLIIVAMSRIIKKNRGKVKWYNMLIFFFSRGILSQLFIQRGKDLYFLPSVPFTFGQYPWVIEIEDSISLFFPYIHNGKTCGVDIYQQPVYQLMKSLLEDPKCRGIITHVESTRKGLESIFQSQEISRKTFFIPMGIQGLELPGKNNNDDVCSFLFINSWHQGAGNFYLRGGLDILLAFSNLYLKHKNKVKLTIRSKLPADLPPEYKDIIQECKVEVIDHFLAREEFLGLYADMDVFLLPSARIHIISLLEAMSCGKCILASDGWGIEEYLQDNKTALIVPGRYNVCSWIDEDNGLLREDYSSLYRGNELFSGKLEEAMSTVVSKPELRERLGQNARRQFEQQHQVENWSKGLNEVFHKII